MRTRNTDSPKSGQGKKAAQAKKETPVADKTQEAAPKPSPKLTPKTSSGAKAARVKPSTPKASTTAEADEANVLVTAESDEIKTNVVDSEKSLEKKFRVKAKSPLGGKAASSPITNEKEKLEEPSSKREGEEIKEDAEDNLVDLGKEPVTKGKDAKSDSDKGPSEAVIEVKQEGVTAKKDEPETNTEVNNEYDVNDDNEDQQVDDEIGQDGLNEADEGFPSAEVGEGDTGEGVEGMGDDEEGTKIEEEEQVQISDMAKARKIKKELEIFVGGLDRDAVEDDLRKTFEKVGEVVEVRLHKDYATNKNKGFAFVKFASKEHVARALEVMKNPMIRGKRCGIAPSEDNDTLFLGNICNTWTKDAIKRKLKDYGIDSVENITLVADTQNEGLSRGFAFLEFACHVDAMAAYKRLQKPDVIFGHPERTAKVAFGEPLREPDPEVMAQVKSVFVDGLPPYWDEDQVKDHFKSFGEIERVVLARNMSTAKRKDFGFVNFTSHEAAVACVDGVNDTELGDDGKSKMKARARLANPLPKTQAVKGGMSGGFRIGHNGIGVYSRFGRGVGRGRFSSNRAGFQGGRVFYSHGRGRGGRFGEVEMPYPDFGGWKPYGVRGGRRGSSASGRLGAFDRGRGRGFPSRRPTYTPEKDFSGHFGTAQYNENPYYYNGGRGLKRPFSMMEHEPSYLESTNRLRPRYDLPDPLTGGSRYRDSLGASGLYSRDYFGSDYGGSSYSSFYGGEPSGGGYYY